MKKIAVLMACHNRREKTLSCLKALYASVFTSQEASFHVYLVDDGSTDGTSEETKKHFPQVKVIQGTGELYWNRGMHLAWQEAAKESHDFFLWLNDDTIIFPDAIAEMLDCASLTDNHAVICGAICSGVNGQFTYGGRNKEGAEIKPNGSVQNCYSINGNCVLIPYSVYKSVGILDPIFPHAIGDFEYGLRVLKKGMKVVTTRKYIANCERNASLPKWCYSTVPLQTRIKALYSPLGNAHPYYFFIYEKRHIGLPIAILHYITIHLRALIPSLWK